MRLTLGAICLLGSLALLYFGLKPSALPKPTEFPDFTIDEPKKDFGEVEPLSVLNAEWTLRNTYAEPVEITSVMKSCGCTTAEVDPKIIPPGGTGKLTATWKVGREAGKVNAAMAVSYSVGGKGQRVLAAQVSSEIVPCVWLEPNKLEFSELTNQTQTISVHARQPNEIQLLGASINSPVFRVESDSVAKTITVTNTQTISGVFNLRVVTNHPKASEIDVPVRILNSKLSEDER